MFVSLREHAECVCMILTLFANVWCHHFAAWAKGNLLSLSPEELNEGLSQFVKEVCRPNGERYSPDSIFYLCLGIQQVGIQPERSTGVRMINEGGYSVRSSQSQLHRYEFKILYLVVYAGKNYHSPSLLYCKWMTSHSLMTSVFSIVFLVIPHIKSQWKLIYTSRLLN